MKINLWKDAMQKTVKFYLLLSSILMLLISFRYIYEEHLGMKINTFIAFEVPLRLQEILFYLFLLNCLLLFPITGLYYLFKRKDKALGLLLIFTSFIYGVATYMALKQF